MTKQLAALVGSRICHDLISPLGAIGNGVELLSLSDGDSSAVMDLITESVENANARIRFFRIAYGAATAEQSVSRTEVLSILAAVAKGGRFTYFWRIESDQNRLDVRTAFLVLQCLEAAMPYGGDISIHMEDGRWVLTATADRLSVEEKLWDNLTTPDPDAFPPASQVQFALLPSVIEEAGRFMSVAVTETTITAWF